ncbi:phosphate ABC transporter permease subunit PstC [Pseudenhygromyxa sp. WMMC2535]|nr:phosphate ABC transporter permease subunit PstC [Pseudenhygromyxa sp. WMMC2535]NVB43534.1 phosphate ABC transporter permease subunit PstC [Pseudenhygromyxa sp. WMMC2535]
MRRRGRPRWHALVEWGIRLLAGAALLAIALIFVFIAREALPLLWSTDARAELRLADLFLPRQWPGYDAPVFVWQPVGPIPKYNLVPLIVGTFKITIMAMLISAPLAIACAVYLAHYSPPRLRELIKPTIEMLAGIPSVVLGFFALSLLADLVSASFGFEYRLNGVVAALALSVTIIPVIFTVSEDALRAVPAAMVEGARALGARRHQIALRVTLPAALPGVAAALVLGFGRAIGETMVVLMASGNAAVVELFDWSTSVRTMTATIAAELGEVPRGTTHWQVLFLVGILLFALTFALNLIAARVVERTRRRLGGEA